MGDSESKKFGGSYLEKLGGQLDKKAPFFKKSLFVGAGRRAPLLCKKKRLP